MTILRLRSRFPLILAASADGLPSSFQSKRITVYPSPRIIFSRSFSATTTSSIDSPSLRSLVYLGLPVEFHQQSQLWVTKIRSAEERAIRRVDPYLQYRGR